jgi:hypothetical protein
MARIAVEQWRARSLAYPGGVGDGGAVPADVRHVLHVRGGSDLDLRLLGVWDYPQQTWYTNLYNTILQYSSIPTALQILPELGKILGLQF